MGLALQLQDAGAAAVVMRSLFEEQFTAGSPSATPADGVTSSHADYHLSPDQYLRSTRLREWARRNKNSKYIPEPLLEAWGFEIESTL